MSQKPKQTYPNEGKGSPKDKNAGQTADTGGAIRGPRMTGSTKPAQKGKQQ